MPLTFNNALDVDVEATVENTPVSEVHAHAKKMSVDFSLTECTLVRRERPGLLMVDFDAGGTTDPRNWARWYKRWVSGLSVIMISLAMSSSGALIPFSAALDSQYGIGVFVNELFVAQFTMSFCVGPLILAPLSEKYGRKPVLLVSWIAFTLLYIGAAVSTAATSVVACHIVAGLFISAPMTISPAVIADVWGFPSREEAMAIYALAIVAPPIGAASGGILLKLGVNQHSVFWIYTIIGALMTVLVAFTMRETYRPLILLKHARRLREETGDDRFKAPLEVPQIDLGLGARCLCNMLARPIRLFIHEPLLAIVSAYLAIIQMCSSIFVQGCTSAFGASTGIVSTLGASSATLIIGGIAVMFSYIFVVHRRFSVRHAEAFAPERVPPEVRLVLSKWAAPVFAVTFFWFGWTLFNTFSSVVPLVSGVVMGGAIFLLVFPVLNYIVEVYEGITASAMASVVVSMNLFPALFPLFSTRMFLVLTPHWALTVAGCIALLVTPFPTLLIRYGSMMRARSGYASRAHA
ncbi:major facilitator superfamily domain-containing protein [Epithele typhae]|uniref:major facilitator superfamily domain-containing protein n=1 Tax=Epithele typhae TaxID=378194 RepID=UPI0020077721|nr:major facilitator superfamily domain-containing protein [Epithele typhae]KAH9941233.1 major facilitator superfamily domain-containing protein [Epithele typhae]